MKKASIWIVVLLVLFVLCLPVSVFADGETTPLTAFITGVIYGSSGSQANYRAPVYTGVDNQFVIVPNDTYSGVSQFRIYFSFNVDSVQTFDLTVRKVTTTWLDASASLSSQNLYLYQYNSSTGAFSNAINIRTSSTQVRSTVDGVTTYHWAHYNSSAYEGYNSVMVVIPVDTAVVGENSPLVFAVDSFVVNGVSVENIAVTEYNEGFAEQISDLAEIEEEMWLDVVAPGIDTWIENQSVSQAMGDYKQVIQAVSMNNFLVPSLIIIVFSFAFYGFALFGRKN